MSLSSVSAGAALRRALGRLEDQAAAAGWAWEAGLSLRVDPLVIQGERVGAAGRAATLRVLIEE